MGNGWASYNSRKQNPLACNYNLRLGTTFDIDFSHRTGALGLTKSSRSGGAMWGVVGPVIILVNRIHLPLNIMLEIKDNF